MWNWWKIHKPIAISRNTLRKLISRQCGDQDFVPLDMSYILVPDLDWLIRHTPKFARNKRDCNRRACKTVANMLGHCVGMVIIPTDNPLVDHCLLIVCMEDYDLMLYDPSLKTLEPAAEFEIKRKWL